MVIVSITNQLKKELQESNFSPLFLENCLNSKFLSIEQNDKKIIGACFVGGIFNSNGIEIIKEFQGMGLGKKLLDEIISECQKRKISFLMGVFKPTNKISIKTHTKIGYRLLFTIFYNHQEGKEIVVILPFNLQGKFLAKFLKFVIFELFQHAIPQKNVFLIPIAIRVLIPLSAKYYSPIFC